MDIFFPAMLFKYLLFIILLAAELKDNEQLLKTSKMPMQKKKKKQKFRLKH